MDILINLCCIDIKVKNLCIFCKFICITGYTV